MSRLYALLYCFENSVRNFIGDRLQESYGVDWWDKGISEAVKKHAQARLESATRDSWLEGDKTELLGFVDFGHLAKIICHAWDQFSDVIPSQQWLTQRLEELEKARHFIAHNRFLLPSEFQRIEMYIRDWEKTVGF